MKCPKCGSELRDHPILTKIVLCSNDACVWMGTREQQVEIERLTKENKILSLKNSGTLANNLCPDHRDKQAGKPCLACEIECLRACLERIKHHEHCDARTADINDLKIGYWATADESEKDFIIMGIAAGHRCCAAIAAEGLEGK